MYSVRVFRPERFITQIAGMGDSFNVLALNVVSHVKLLVAFYLSTHIAGICTIFQPLHHGIYGVI